MTEETGVSEGLLPCPFCGNEARTATYETESLWSHDQVTYTKVFCDECDVSFATEPGYELEAPAAWNRRAAPPPAPTGEAVAWRWQEYDHPEDPWIYGETGPRPQEEHANLTALYAAPPAPSADSGVREKVIGLQIEARPIHKHYANICEITDDGADAILQALAHPAPHSGGLGSFSQEAKIPTCSPEFARLVLPSIYTALDCVVSPTGGIAQERLEYVVDLLQRARDASHQADISTAEQVGSREAAEPKSPAKAPERKGG